MITTISKNIVPMTYYTGVPNIGDLFNADLVSAVSDSNIYQVSDISLPHLLAVGSTMEWASPKSIVWGTGFMKSDSTTRGVRSERIYAIRGSLTKKRLSDLEIRTAVPLGDPAFLIPELVKIENLNPKYQLGAIPHYVDRKDPFFVELSSRTGVKIINVSENNLQRFIDDMADCKTIVSSSLHGLIFAEALGIPNLWIDTGGPIHGSGFKFHDWFSTTKQPQADPFRPTTDVATQDLIKLCRLHDSLINKDDLRESFPKEILIQSGNYLKNTPNFRNYKVCRTSSMPIFIDASKILSSTSIETTIVSALNSWKNVSIFIAGPFALFDKFDKFDNKIIQCLVNNTGIDDKFMHNFWKSWAEPQKHIVVEAGFDFNNLNVAKEFDDALIDNPGLDALIIDSNKHRAIYRRAGRWF